MLPSPIRRIFLNGLPRAAVAPVEELGNDEDVAAAAATAAAAADDVAVAASIAAIIVVVDGKFAVPVGCVAVTAVEVVAAVVAFACSTASNSSSSSSNNKTRNCFVSFTQMPATCCCFCCCCCRRRQLPFRVAASSCLPLSHFPALSMHFIVVLHLPPCSCNRRELYRGGN